MGFSFGIYSSCSQIRELSMEGKWLDIGLTTCVPDVVAVIVGIPFVFGFVAITYFVVKERFDVWRDKNEK